MIALLRVELIWDFFESVTFPSFNVFSFFFRAVALRSWLHLFSLGFAACFVVRPRQGCLLFLMQEASVVYTHTKKTSFMYDASFMYALPPLGGNIRTFRNPAFHGKIKSVGSVTVTAIVISATAE